MRYFVGFLVTVGLIILAILLLFNSGGSDVKKVPVSTRSLTSYATDSGSQVRMTEEGPVVANEDQNSLIITVSNSSVTYTQYAHYGAQVLSSKTYANSVNAYKSFLSSLNYAGYDDGDTTASLKDETGRCATGDTFVFEVVENGKTLQRFWVTSCGGTKTYKGNANATIDLFQSQVPNFNDTTDGLNF